MIVIGIIMLVWTGFSYTKKENIIDAGPVHLSADRQKTVSWPPVVGGVILVAGVVVFFTCRKSV